MMESPDLQCCGSDSESDPDDDFEQDQDQVDDLAGEEVDDSDMDMDMTFDYYISNDSNPNNDYKPDLGDLTDTCEDGNLELEDASTPVSPGELDRGASQAPERLLDQNNENICEMNERCCIHIWLCCAALI